MAGVAHSKAFAEKVGIPQKVGRDFNEADKGTGILSRADGGMVKRRNDEDGDAWISGVNRHLRSSGKTSPEDAIQPGEGKQKQDYIEGGADRYDPFAEHAVTKPLARGGILGRDMGGYMPSDGGGIGGSPLPTPDPLSGGLAPSVATANPMAQSAYQRYQNLPPEKLQELAVRLPAGSQQGAIVRRVLQAKRMQPQGGGAGIVAGQSPAPQSTGAPGYQSGGMLGVPLSEADPWWTRAEARSTGYLHGATLGRADNITTTAPGGSHIVPADVISGLGEGNSLAGARVFDMMLRSGPWGIPQQQQHRGAGPPRPPRPYPAQGQRQGGVARGAGEHVPVKLSHGESQVGPEWVLQIGRHFVGPHASERHARNAGHRFLDHWIVHERKKIAKTMLKLPGPVKSAA